MKPTTVTDAQLSVLLYQRQHVAGEWAVIRVGGIMIAQGAKCSCGVIGCGLAKGEKVYAIVTQGGVRP